MRWRCSPCPVLTTALIGCVVFLPAQSGLAQGRSALALKLEIATGQSRSPPPRPSASGAALVLNSMSEEDRERLADSLAGLAAAVDKKKNPLFVSLDDSDERAAVESLLARTTPAFSAAVTLCAGRWQSREGDVQVRPVSRCAPGTRCVALAAAPGSDESERRARFLAWPLGYAIVLGTASPGRAADVAQALRAPGSTQIALVLTGTELHRLRKSPALDRLLAHARHIVRTVPPKPSPLLNVVAKVANAASAQDELTWFDLPDDSILVVPRLGALATSAAFVSDVRARLQSNAARVDWVVSPPDKSGLKAHSD